MRRIAAGLGVSLLAAGALAGCGPSAVSYRDGFAVGQSVAAARVSGSLRGHAVLVTCRQQWRTSGPSSDDRAVWIRGCVAGIHRLEATVGS
ncbi:MAG TPA: hypothetical protein VGZ03_06195 [Acidimicrobiales bacterium]|jgi:hypothetical protein|nr:hypothetical protein [Acidimicrobiales bacterium]